MRNNINTEKSIEWLLENGNATIRYRILTELLNKTGEEDKKDLIESPSVTGALEKVGSPGGLFSFIHHKIEAFSNISWKLYQLGLRAGMNCIDEKMMPFKKWLIENQHVYPEEGGQAIQLEECKNVCAFSLLRFGYHDDLIISRAKNHIDACYAFAKMNQYDLLIPNTSVPDLPKAFNKYPVLNVDLTENICKPPEFSLLCMLAFLPKKYLDGATVKKVDTILSYMSNPQYLDRKPVYIRAGKGHYYVTGFGLGLPEIGRSDIDKNRLILFAYHLSKLDYFKNSVWIKTVIHHLDSFSTDRNTWKFPATYILDKSNGYWDRGGAYMGLGENRKTRLSIEIESTFYMVALLDAIKKM